MFNNAWTAFLLGVLVVQLQGRSDERELTSFLDRRLSATTSLFCFTVVSPNGFEASLLAQQRFYSVGLFNCDGHTVISNVSAAELFGGVAPDGIDVSVIDDPFEEVNPQLENGVVKASAFVKVWAKLLNDGMIAQYDWTVKLAVDTVFLPDVMRYRLNGRCTVESCKPVFVTSSGSSNGAIEVLSKTAVMYYVANGWSCESRINPSEVGEGEYLSKCLASLMIPDETEPKLLLEGGAACDTEHAAFRPYLSWTSYEDCLYEAGITPTTSTPMPSLVARFPGDYALSMVPSIPNPALLRKIAIVVVVGLLMAVVVTMQCCWRHNQQPEDRRDIQMAPLTLNMDGPQRSLGGPDWAPVPAPHPGARERSNSSHSQVAVPVRAQSNFSNWGFKPSEQPPERDKSPTDREALLQWLR